MISLSPLTTWSPSLNSLSLETSPSHLKFQQCQSYGSLTGQLSFPHQTISHI
jgi:hypothetical protein